MDALELYSSTGGKYIREFNTNLAAGKDGMLRWYEIFVLCCCYCYSVYSRLEAGSSVWLG
jgi:hypothetical protein